MVLQFPGPGHCAVHRRHLQQTLRADSEEGFLVDDDDGESHWGARRSVVSRVILVKRGCSSALWLTSKGVLLCGTIIFFFNSY